MRVLFVSGEYPPMQGGVGDCTNEIAKALARLGVEAHVLTAAYPSTKTGREGQQPDTERECDVDIHRPVKKWTWSALRMVTKTARELKPTVVHIQYQTGAFGMHPAINFLPRLIGTLSPSPFARGSRWRSHPLTITTFHDLRVPYLFPKAGWVREWVTRFLARSSDAVIATSNEDLLSLQAWGLGHLLLIPIGSNIPTAPPPDYRRAEWRARLGVGQDTILLSYFGFLNESKGAETLIRALVHLPAAKLLMIGGQVGASDPTNVTYLARVQSLIAELELTARVVWTDFVPASKVSANFLASDICVLPFRDGASYRRGSFMAALAHGLPIVTTHPPSVPNPLLSYGLGSKDPQSGGKQGFWLPALRDGENVLMAPPDDPRALADAISRVAAHPELRFKLSNGARELAAHFTWDKIAQQHLDLYQLLTGTGSQVSGLSPRVT